MKQGRYKIVIKIEADSKEDVLGILGKMHKNNMGLSTSEFKVNHNTATATVKSNVGEMMERQEPTIKIIEGQACQIYQSKLNNE